MSIIKDRMFDKYKIDRYSLIGYEKILINDKRVKIYFLYDKQLGIILEKFINKFFSNLDIE